MNQDTRTAFMQILAEAQKKAAEQSKLKKGTMPAPEIIRAVSTPDEQISRSVERSAPTPMPEPVQQQNSPELSDLTFADLFSSSKPEKPKNPYNLQIIDYSDKAVAVIGDTKAVKATLQAHGGKYNPFLKCGKGWIFPKYKEPQIRSQFGI